MRPLYHADKPMDSCLKKIITSTATIILILVLLPAIVAAIEKADLVIVDKSKAKLYLKKSGLTIKEYKVAFGANPEGHKQRKGDERTPEGVYILDYKNDDSEFYKGIHISYPNKADIHRARERNVNPGGAIMIHGQRNGLDWLTSVVQRYNWTDGCIAVTNHEMDEIWDAIDVGTPIIIHP